MSHRNELAPAPDIAYSVAEVAKRLQTSPYTIRGLIHAGRLKAKYLGKQRVIRVPASALAAFLAESDFPPGEDEHGP